jgi:hypothetical protein
LFFFAARCVCDVMRYDAMQYAIHCDAMRCDAMQMQSLQDEAVLWAGLPFEEGGVDFVDFGGGGGGLGSVLPAAPPAAPPAPLVALAAPPPAMGMPGTDVVVDVFETGVEPLCSLTVPDLLSQVDMHSARAAVFRACPALVQFALQKLEWSLKVYRKRGCDVQVMNAQTPLWPLTALEAQFLSDGACSCCWRIGLFVAPASGKKRARHEDKAV